MKVILLGLLFVSWASALTPAERAKVVLNKMTLDEKIVMVHGVAGEYVGNIPGNNRLGIPALHLNDGPQGFRPDDKTLFGTSTAWPSGLTMAAAWNAEMMEQWGKAMGEEFWAKGANVQLGPGMNVARVPLDGRNFEYLSGEDPFLGATLVQPVVRGIQSQNVIATAKHYINNNQETQRIGINAILDERTEYEIYLPPFLSALDAGCFAYMCSYNKINGDWACESNATLNEDLKMRGKFAGFVMSDWSATHSTVKAALAGLDQEFPTGIYFANALKQAVESNQVPMDVLNDKVYRILFSMFSIGLFDRNNTNSIENNVTSVEHNQLARLFSGQGAVLLKNYENLLPLKNVQRIAVIGDAADAKPVVVGGGSGTVPVPYIVTVLQGVTNRAGSSVHVTYSKTADTNVLDQAKAADVVVFVTATDSSEGSDRSTLALPAAEDALLAKIIKVQPHTVAVVVSPGAVLLPWLDQVPVALAMFMSGQEQGNAVADVLFGSVCPSGHLPLTFPNMENEVEFTQDQYPGLPADHPANEHYSEMLNVGYRWYHTHKVQPKLCFGHGLSYTTFSLQNLVVHTDSQGVDVSFSVTNNGTTTCAAVPQVYVSFPEAAQEPPVQLKGFSKVVLKPGEHHNANIRLHRNRLAIWDVKVHDWQVIPGEFDVYVGFSSCDTPLHQTVQFA